MRALWVSVVGFPLLSRAGVNRARLRMIRQVVLSSAEFPLEPVTEQPVARPSAPTVTVIRVVPSASARCADAG